jgi:hypothetical protein
MKPRLLILGEEIPPMSLKSTAHQGVGLAKASRLPYRLKKTLTQPQHARPGNTLG